MKKYTYRDSEINVVSSWDEITMKMYCQMMDLESKKALYFDEMTYITDFLEIYSDRKSSDIFDEFDEEVLIQINEDMSTWIGNIPENIDKEHFVYKDINFVMMKREHLSSGMTLGEKKAIERILTSDPNASLAKMIIPMLSIIIRPGYIKHDEVLNIDEWKMHKLDQKYFEISEEAIGAQRAQDVAGFADFFLSGLMQSITNLKTSSTPDQEKMESH